MNFSIGYRLCRGGHVSPSAPAAVTIAGSDLGLSPGLYVWHRDRCGLGVTHIGSDLGYV